METSSRDAHSNSVRFESIGLGLGAGGVILLAGVLVPARDSMGTANVALLLSVVVVLAALTSRLAGIGTAVVAALSFNFFHTQPYQSLRISNGRDIATVGLLLFVGIVVSWVGEWRRAASRRADMHRTGEHSLESVVAVAASGATAERVLEVVCESLVHDLRLADCRFEAAPASERPIIERHGAIASRHLRLGADGFELPPDGAAIRVVSNDRTYGQLVLTPRHGSSTNIEQRRAAVALVDLYALVLDRERADVDHVGDRAPRARPAS
jgi:hypothetical protein